MKAFQNYIWGIYLIVMGIVCILKYYYKLNISIPKIAAGLFLVFLGLYLLGGGFEVQSDTDLIFSRGTIDISQTGKEYNVIFSNGTIALSDLPVSEYNSQIEVNVVFSNATLMLDPGRPAIVKINTVFGKTDSPDGASTVFGEHVYKTSVSNEEGKALEIEANTVFGNLNILNQGLQ